MKSITLVITLTTLFADDKVIFSSVNYTGIIPHRGDTICLGVDVYVVQYREMDLHTQHLSLFVTKE